MCWADNAVGQQREPCVFHLIAAGKPEMPYNCSLTNQTSNSLEVDCAEAISWNPKAYKSTYTLDPARPRPHCINLSRKPCETLEKIEFGTAHLYRKHVPVHQQRACRQSRAGLSSYYATKNIHLPNWFVIRDATSRFPRPQKRASELERKRTCSSHRQRCTCLFHKIIDLTVSTAGCSSNEPGGPVSPPTADHSEVVPDRCCVTSAGDPIGERSGLLVHHIDSETLGLNSFGHYD
ncbi:conserved hypothetical protein [Culex quinquefasciatus]|uniref:Uncharacterized protein n=1 Tax=Culex quinquefasciatus TaxID=7176 RepID=B0WJY9_CULQU|nr:conserved hypothetical protein [Culex quinquefasciatus]|eukprot:XP_001849023.1 conserved hypothetical protein [Culex quinquefasciatus]